jgi:hypothetical protein
MNSHPRLPKERPLSRIDPYRPTFGAELTGAPS